MVWLKWIWKFWCWYLCAVKLFGWAWCRPWWQAWRRNKWFGRNSFRGCQIRDVALVFYEQEKWLGKVIEKREGQVRARWCLEKPFGVNMLQNMEREHDAVFYHNVYKANVKPWMTIWKWYWLKISAAVLTCSKYNKKLLIDCLIWYLYLF